LKSLNSSDFDDILKWVEAEWSQIDTLAHELEAKLVSTSEKEEDGSEISFEIVYYLNVRIVSEFFVFR